MIKYVYVVSRRILEGENAIKHNSPNLGVFSSEKKAHEFFESVISDRETCHLAYVKRRPVLDLNRYMTTRLAIADIEYIELKEKVFEELRLEKWDMQ